MTIGSQVKQCLASVKGIESILSGLAIKANDENTKRLLHESMMVAESVTVDLQKRVGELEREESEYKGF